MNFSILKDEDSSVRMSAASALGVMKSEKAVDPLIRALKDVLFSTTLIPRPGVIPLTQENTLAQP